LDRKKLREALSPKPVKFPSLEYVRQLTDSIKIETEIDQRDRALISFLFSSGMRDKAVATLPLGCFDRETLEIQQDFRAGVDTKFGKSIDSNLLRFDERLVEYVLEWAEYLEKTKLSAPAHPMFPRNRVEQIEGGLTFVSRRIEPIFWKGTGSIRDILKRRSAEAGLDYYCPHSFRHGDAHLAMKHCRNAEEMKAISQNFGHETVGTTLYTYGKLDIHQVREIIGKIDFSASDKMIDREEAKVMPRKLERIIDRP